MDFTITIYRNYLEQPADFQLSTSRYGNLRFGTILHGGFGSAEFTLKTGRLQAISYYSAFLNYHVVILDQFGRRVYEGRIDDVGIVDAGISVSCAGYYANSNEQFDGLVYDATVPDPVYAHEIIDDLVDLADQWEHVHNLIQTTNINLGDKDFSDFVKLNAVVEEACKYGYDDGANPRPLYFAVYDYRIPRLFPEPLLASVSPDWVTFTRDLEKGSRGSFKRSMKEVYNRLWVKYDTDDGERFWPDENGIEDLDSQARYGIREGVLNIGKQEEAVAATMGAMAIKKYAWPKQAADLAIIGSIYTPNRMRENSYMLRAGHVLRVDDFDPGVADLQNGGSGGQALKGLITRTDYDVDRHMLSLEFGSQTYSLDTMLARYGIGGGLS